MSTLLLILFLMGCNKPALTPAPIETPHLFMATQIEFDGTSGTRRWVGHATEGYGDLQNVTLHNIDLTLFGDLGSEPMILKAQNAILHNTDQKIDLRHVTLTIGNRALTTAVAVFSSPMQRIDFPTSLQLRSTHLFITAPSGYGNTQANTLHLNGPVRGSWTPGQK